MKIYLVGGAVRDKLMGIEPKDLDYVMVLNNIKGKTVEEGYAIMKKYMQNEGFTIWLENPEMFTIRAKFPPHYKFKGDADFVLARKEVGYEENSRRPKLELGTLYDDLQRRDFTINAMAEDDNGNIIDYFNGIDDLKLKILRTPLPEHQTFLDDPLRVLRAFRFSITKDMSIPYQIKYGMNNPAVIEKLKNVVSQERVREELLKMFKHDTQKTLELLVEADKTYLEGILNICFYNKGLWLKPTFEKI